jgi:hypothetical protein
VERCGIASVSCDPVSRIGSQDEAVYGREAIDMAAHGNWLTPAYLGRYALNKPPLLQILAAASVRVLGPSAWALRLPSLIAAALTATLIFSLLWRSHSLAAAAGATLLLLCSHLFYVFSRLSMTDMLLTLWLTLAMFVLAWDPALGRSRSIWIFSFCSGAAILTKAAAGTLPLVALLIHSGLARGARRPRIARVTAVFGLAAAVALPWHLYQLLVHTRWFIAEYVLTAHFSVGLTAPPQYSSESHLVFYARRMFLMDPPLTLLAALALAPLARNWRRSSVSLAWVAAALFALFAFRYRSGYYLLPLIPASAFVAGERLSKLPRRAHPAVLALVAVCCAIKVASGSPVWGIPANVRSETVAAPALERYCGLDRGNGLILVDPDDEFYASILPIARVRYALLGREPPAPPIDYASLGIWLSANQFAQLAKWLPLYRRRLREFALSSDAAVGTVIWVTSPKDLDLIIESHPESDFSLPARLVRNIHLSSSHRTAPSGGGRVFLLSANLSKYSEPRPCRL